MATAQNLDRWVGAGKEKGFEIEQGVEYGAGPIDVVWNINVHPALPNIKCGFVRLEAEWSGSQHLEDNQLSLRKIEEAAIRSMGSGLDKVYLVTDRDSKICK